MHSVFGLFVFAACNSTRMPSSRKWLHYGGGDCSSKARSVAVTSCCTAAASPCGGSGGGGGGATQQGPQGPQGVAGDAEAAIYGNEVQPYAAAGVTNFVVGPPPASPLTLWFGDAQAPPSATFTAAAFTMTRAGRLTSFWSAMEDISLIFAGPESPQLSVGVWKAEPGDPPLLIASRPLPSAGDALPMASVVGEANLDSLLMPGDRVAMGITMTNGGSLLSAAQWTWSSVSGSVLV